MMDLKSVAASAAAFLFAFFTIGSAQGADSTTTMTCGTSAMICGPVNTGVEIELDDTGANPGEILVTMRVANQLAKDIRAVFFNIALDPAALSGLYAYGSPLITSYGYGDVIDLGRGANLYGEGTPCPCSFGVEIGTPGKGKDVVPMVEFILAHESLQLTLDMFYEQYVGARISGNGGKCVGVLPIPDL